MRRVLCVLCVLLFTIALRAEDASKLGPSRVTWPLPADDVFGREYTALGTRHGFKIPEDYPQKIREKSQSKTPEGIFADPAYDLYVPRDYAPGKMFGLLVWINSGDGGAVPRDTWRKTLDKHHLIWVGPADVGNDRDTLWRTYMSIEAVRSARLHFTALDDERIYVAGFSGGGRIASHSALVAADTFTGGFYVAGCDFFRDVPVDPNDPRGKHYRGFWRKPDGKLLRTSKTNRFVLLSGTGDFNRENTHSVHAAYVKAGYKHVTLLDVPGLGHSIPDARWFDKAVAALDAPLTPPAKLYEQATQLLERKQVGEACLVFGRAAVRGAGQPFAADAQRKSAAVRAEYDKQLAEVRTLLDAGKLDAADKANAKVKSQYGDLAARQTAELATEIKTKKIARAAREQ